MKVIKKCGIAFIFYKGELVATVEECRAEIVQIELIYKMGL